MDFNLNFQLVLLAVLLVLSAFFAISETSLMSVNRYRLKHLSKQGNVGAKLAIKLLNETDKLLSVILLCNNFANAAAAALVTLIVVEFFGTQESIIFIGTIITTFMIVIFSEISPKVIGAAHPEKLAPYCSFHSLSAPKSLLSYRFIFEFFCSWIFKARKHQNKL